MIGCLLLETDEPAAAVEPLRRSLALDEGNADAHYRLGLALKVTTHDLVRAAYPALLTVDTSNAEINTHMNAVNETLGYRPIETLLELQKVL